MDARHAVLPVLLGIFPAVFHYANNVGIAMPSTVFRLAAAFAGVSLTIYVVCLMVSRNRGVQAALSASVLTLVLHTYGLLSNALRIADAVRIEHYTLMPVVLYAGFNLAWLVSKIGLRTAHEIWRGGVLIVSVLLVMNAAKIAYSVIRTSPTPATAYALPSAPSSVSKYPDVYYFVYDEMAGFEAVRQYWKYPAVDSFVRFLQSHGFYVAESSHAAYPETLYELAQRFNYEAYPPYDRNKKSQYQEDMANGRALKYLEDLGYTTIAFDQTRSAFGFPAGPPMQMDIVHEQAPADAPQEELGAWDGFTLLVLDNTILNPWVSGIKLESPAADANRHKSMILYTMRALSQLHDVPAPRFVYVHLLLPHVPFMFRPDGSLGSAAGYFDWSNYLDNYKFTIPLIERSVRDILSLADPDNPPVIIIQSDHGARNLDSGLGTMPNFPDEYKTLIVNAVLLPGCDQSVLTQDMNPINTLPIVFNCYFNADIPLVK